MAEKRKNYGYVLALTFMMTNIATFNWAHVSKNTQIVLGCLLILTLVAIPFTIRWSKTRDEKVDSKLLFMFAGISVAHLAVYAWIIF